MEFSTIAVANGIVMGTAGMRASLVNREMIEDSIELMSRAHYRDALPTGGCFSGATRGLMVGHVTPEAAAGGPIGLLREDDVIVIGVASRRLEAEADLTARIPARRAPYARSGALAHYALLVGSASRGAVRAGFDNCDYQNAGA